MTRTLIVVLLLLLVISNTPEPSKKRDDPFRLALGGNLTLMAKTARRKRPDERRRREGPRRAILRSARTLFHRRGLRDLTIEAIAADAGVGKATIYRWWPSKAALVLDAIHDQVGPEIAFPDTGSAREDLRLQIASLIEILTSTRTGRAFIALVAESQHDPALAEAIRDRLIAGRRAATREVLERGIARGELRADLDMDIAIDALYGALYYRLLVSHEPLEPDHADALIAHLYPALASSGQPGHPSATRKENA
jgi:AcrR family transcriptional regulator